MKVTILSDDFTENLHISPSSIKSCVNNYDQEQNIIVEEKVFKIFLKKIEKSDPKYFLLVGGDYSSSNNEFTLSFALKIYKSLHENIEFLSPLFILNLFQKKFGIECTIGDVKSKLFIKQKLKSNGSNINTVIKSNENRDMHPIGETIVRVHKPFDYIYVLIHFWFDLNSYLNWIAENKAGVAPCSVKTKNYEYDVAISFAGEERQIAERLALNLEEKGLNVFYDRNKEYELWGKDLLGYLSEIYSKKAKYCIMLISKHYVSKYWPTHERRHAQARALKQQDEYILPIKIDDIEVPGMPETVGYISLKDRTISEISNLLRNKIEKNS